MTASTYGATMLSCVAVVFLGYLSCADTAEELSQPDMIIHAMLRDMTALMTEQRNQLQASMDRLQDSEGLIKEQRIQLQTAMDRLIDSETLIKEQRTELQQTQQELRAAMGRLTDSGSLIKASVETIEARSNATQHEVQFLQMQNEVRQVAFSASLLASGGGNTGPYNVDTILTYRHVFTNVGNGYHPDTGFFIAPVKAVYQFNIFVYGLGASHASAVKLFKNGQHVVTATEHQPTHTVNPSNGVSLLLEAEDVVYVKLWANTWIRDHEAHHSTFSGHLLFTM